MSCQTCGRPERVLWTYGSLPSLHNVEPGSWIDLDECPRCAALWCPVLHEPYLSFTFVTWWPYDRATWRQIYELDGGRSLLEWHDAVIRETWELLPEGAKADIEAWRRRTYYGHNPIDQGPSKKGPEKIWRTTDLDRLIKSS